MLINVLHFYNIYTNCSIINIRFFPFLNLLFISYYEIKYFKLYIGIKFKLLLLSICLQVYLNSCF